MPLKSLTPRVQRGGARAGRGGYRDRIVIAAGLMRYVLSEYQAAHLPTGARSRRATAPRRGEVYAMDALIKGEAVTNAEVTLVNPARGRGGQLRVTSTQPVTTAPACLIPRAMCASWLPGSSSEEEVLAGRGVSRGEAGRRGKDRRVGLGSDAALPGIGVEMDRMTIHCRGGRGWQGDPWRGLCQHPGYRRGGGVRNTSSNKAHVAGPVSAPGQVDLSGKQGRRA